MRDSGVGDWCCAAAFAAGSGGDPRYERHFGVSRNRGWYLFLIILGFPITVGLAWAVDITEQGVRRTEKQAAAGWR